MDRTVLVPNEEVDYETSEYSLPEQPRAAINDVGPTPIAEHDHRAPIIHKANEGGMTCALLMLTLLSAIGGFLFGYDTGVISGAMISLRVYFKLDSIQQELIVSGAIGAAALSAMVSGVLNDLLGRKVIILIASLVFTVGSILMSISETWLFLLLGRLVVGIGIGLASMTVPVYIAESAPAHLRGKLVLSNNIFITAGMLTASIIDGLFHHDKVNGWRYMLGIAAVPSALQFIGFIFMPESPRWLVTKKKYGKAKKALQSIRKVTPEDINNELEEIKLAHLDSLHVAHSTSDKMPVIVRMLRQDSTRRALLVGCGLQMFQQLAGINTVMYYSASIIAMSGVRDQGDVVWLAAAVSAINVLFSFVGLYFIDRLGRRRLALASLVGVLFSLCVLAVGFQMAAIYSPPVNIVEDFADPCSAYAICDKCIDASQCGYCFQDNGHGSATNASCLLTNDTYSENSLFGRCADKATMKYNHTIWAHYCPTVYSWIAMIGLPLYLAFFAPGMGPIPWTINAEIYPLWARSTGTAIATSVNWIFNLFVSITFLSLTKAITPYGTYWLYSGLVVLSIMFVAKFVPETKGKTLEEIEALFEVPWF